MIVSINFPLNKIAARGLSKTRRRRRVRQRLAWQYRAFRAAAHALGDPETIARIARMRDYGSAFLEHAPAVVLVEGDRTATEDVYKRQVVLLHVAGGERAVEIVDQGDGQRFFHNCDCG